METLQTGSILQFGDQPAKYQVSRPCLPNPKYHQSIVGGHLHVFELSQENVDLTIKCVSDTEWKISGTEETFPLHIFPARIPELTVRMPQQDYTHQEDVCVKPRYILEESGLPPQDLPPVTLSSKMFRTAWRPVIGSFYNLHSPIQNILVEPWMKHDQDWSLDSKGNPLIFYAQFIDPNDEKHLTQIFISELSDQPLKKEDITTEIRKIHVSEIIPANGKVRTPPRMVPLDLRYRGGWIMDWVKIDTIFVGNDNKLGNDMEIFTKDHLGTEHDFDHLLQLGGVAPSMFGKDYQKDHSTYYQGICNRYCYNCGGLNLTQDGDFYGDSV